MVIIRSKTRKNRLAKPIEIEFHISHQKGMNPFVGLQDYVSWENCGVGRGKKLTEKEYSKLKPEEQADCKAFTVNGETFYFKPGPKAQNYIISHNGDEVPIRQFFTSRLFTDDVLRLLDENVIKQSLSTQNQSKVCLIWKQKNYLTRKQRAKEMNFKIQETLPIKYSLGLHQSMPNYPTSQDFMFDVISYLIRVAESREKDWDPGDFKFSTKTLKYVFGDRFKSDDFVNRIKIILKDLLEIEAIERKGEYLYISKDELSRYYSIS